MARAIIVLTAIVIGCSQSTEPEYPEWVNALIITFRSMPVGNPPQSIWRYEYRGEVVYYVPPQCCDQYSMLFDQEGNVICAPAGGFSGRGDRRCPDFFAARTSEKLVWKDARGR